MSQYKFVLLILGALSVGACSKNTIPDPAPDDSVYDASASGGATDGMDSDSGLSGEEIEYDPSAGELGNIIYFDFDSSEVRAEDTDRVSRHAAQLREDPALRVRLEGHADERGSREYNIGLGERRAQAVRRLLLIQGAAATQISTVSFGEERPAADGSDEFAYEQNRRVEIRYTN